MPYSGSCHCGAVQFVVDHEPAELTTCDCSLCRKKHAVMFAAPAERLTITAGEGALSEYRWNTRVARHFFCSMCGIYVFHRKRSAPDQYGVNVYCLEGFDPSAYPLRQAEGVGMSVTADAASRFPGPQES
jgi:hypothetical protein